MPAATGRWSLPVAAGGGQCPDVRVKQAPPPPVDTITHALSAIALRQRPPVPGRHSTVGTLTQT